MTSEPLPAQVASHYEGRKCVVTGGASFIGSHLVDLLAGLGAEVVVIDDFSSGKAENLADHAGSSQVSVRECDLRDPRAAAEAFEPSDVVFHLAAIHGGRGFIEAFPSQMLVNLAIDHTVYSLASRLGTDMVVQASSACAYPIASQEDAQGRGLLAEDLAGFERPDQSFPDGTYGWLKLMGEYQLKVIAESGESSMSGRSARIFTAYGERENESHAAVALIAKALLGADPYPIWGTGEQTRNFTHVMDTATGLLLLGSDQSEARYDVFNIGSSVHHTILEFLNVVFDCIGWRPSEIERQTQFPTGVGNRASDNGRILDAFSWEPSITLGEGVKRTVDWYGAYPGRATSMDELNDRLLAR